MLANALRTLLRRWFLLVVALVVGALAGGAVFVAMPATHRATASVLFLPSLRQPGVEGETNPLLALSGSVAVVASVLQIAATDEETQLRLAAEGHGAKYEVTPDLSENAGPVLLVTAESPRADLAKSTRDAVIAELTTTLARLQAERKVPADLYVTAVTLTSNPKTEVLRKKQIQAGVAAGGALTACGLLLILWRERTRPRSRDADPEEPDHEGQDVDDGPDRAAPLPSPQGHGLHRRDVHGPRMDKESVTTQRNHALELTPPRRLSTPRE